MQRATLDLTLEPCRPPAPGPDGVSGSRHQTAESRLRAVERVIEAMHARFREPLSVAVLARIALFSPFHFDRFFAEITGIPPLRFLSAIRIQEAKRLLLDSEYPVARIAGEVGYNSLGTFTRQFTDQVGVSPGRFRRSAEETSQCCGSEELPAVCRAGPGGVRVEVQVPEGFTGRVFLGLFLAALPRGRPVACTVADGPGAAMLNPPADGTYFLFAAGIPAYGGVAESLLCGDAPRGRAGPVELRRGRELPAIHVALRPPAFTDAPLVLALPFAVLERLARHAPDGAPPGPPPDRVRVPAVFPDSEGRPTSSNGSLPHSPHQPQRPA